ncbi:MAG: hypothetical protein KF893_08100 [Caldilineaceae bacterium]|nr:hypothetical protein [Caldilineaceae bacterium]
MIGKMFGTRNDVTENMLNSIDKNVKKTTGTSLFHILTVASIVASIAFFLSGKKMAGVFIGLWPPTFQALKSASENK